MSFLWGFLSATGILGAVYGFFYKTIKKVLSDILSNALDDFIMKKLDPTLEKYMGDKYASDLERLVAKLLEEKAKTLEKAAETDSYPNKEG